MLSRYDAFLILPLVPWLLLLGQAPPAQGDVRREALSWPTMGTFAEVVIVADSPPRNQRLNRAFASVRDAFDRVDRTMSVYRAESDINRVNRWAGHRFVGVDPWLADLLSKGRRAYHHTGGAFSLNVLSPGVRLGLKPGSAVAGGTEGSGRWIRVWRNRVFLAFPGMALDAGGIAKGYALDRAAERLRARGYSRFFLSLGRNVLAGEAPPGQSGWPVKLAGEKTTRSITNLSVAVSRQGLRSDTGHVVDPRTGDPVTAERWTAVGARRGWVADMASTALLVDPSLKSRLRNHYPSIEWIRVGTVEP